MFRRLALVGLLFSGCHSHWAVGQTLDLNRLKERGIDSLSMKAGCDLKVKFHGMNTVNWCWVKHIDSDSTFAWAECMATERVSMSVERIPAGDYEVGYAGCWSDYSFILHVSHFGPK